MNKLKISILASMLLLAGPALALNYVNTTVNAGVNTGTSGTSVNVDANLTTRIQIGKSRADQEIDRRIEALNSLKTRVNALSRVTADEKTNLSVSIQSQIDLLTNLKTKIASDSDLATLKTDIKSITNSYRIFVLIIPQGHIAATVDSLNTTGDLLATFSTKLKTRIDASTTGDKDAMNALLSEMNAKIANAKVETDAAINLTSNLKPDNGDKTVLQSNNQALISARAKIKDARADLQTARNDAQKIVVSLKTSANVNASASSTTQY